MNHHYEIEYSKSLIRVRSSGVFDYLSAYEMWKEIAMDQEYTYTIRFDETLVRPTTSGSFDYLRALQMWQEINATCEEQQCFRILVISKIDEPVATPDAYNASEFLIPSVSRTSIDLPS